MFQQVQNSHDKQARESPADSSRLQHHWGAGGWGLGGGGDKEARSPGKLTGSAAVSKVCCSMKEERSNPQHRVREGPSALIAIGW